MTDTDGEMGILLAQPALGQGKGVSFQSWCLVTLHSSSLPERLYLLFHCCSLLCTGAKSLQLCPTLCDPVVSTHQAPLFMGFSRQEYWTGLLCPAPGESSRTRDQTRVSCGFCTAGGLFTTEPPGKPHSLLCVSCSVVSASSGPHGL